MNEKELLIDGITTMEGILDDRHVVGFREYELSLLSIEELRFLHDQMCYELEREPEIVYE